MRVPVFYDFSQIVLIITAGLLFYVAFNDLKNYRIRNEFNLVLMGLYFIHAFVSGRWQILPWNLLFAVLMFIPLFIAYSLRLLGGGDVKLLTVAFLWTGFDCALLFAVFLLGFSLCHFAVVKIKEMRAVEKSKRVRVAYAPSIAAALIVTFMLGCLAPLFYTPAGPIVMH